MGMKKVVLTGSQGFIGTYLCAELLSKGYKVFGYDNYSKYGKVVRPHDNHPNFHLFNMDLTKREPDFIESQPDCIILGAAKIGGISYFHKYAADLVLDNETIMANCYRSILKLWKSQNNLERVVTLSSSMVFEGADQWHKNLVDFHGMDGYDSYHQTWPTDENAVKAFPPPYSTYGFQKLMCEYWAKGFHEQYGIPYTIVRPFNAVGAYENEAIGEAEVMSGNVKLQMSHVLPDLINKCLKGQDPLHILGDGLQVRCYTNGKDIARGIVMAMESKKGLNNDFNISTEESTSVLELAIMVWERINGEKPFRHVEDKPFEFDVQRRIPCTFKAESLLGFKAQIPLSQSIDEVVEWMKGQNDSYSKR
jgi:nucleoside-diphosphate-sugar epimerase